MPCDPLLPPRVRVLLLVGTLERGGAEGQLVALAKGLDTSRFDVRVCGLTAGGPLEAPLHAAGIPVDIIGWHGFAPFSGLGRLAAPVDFMRVVFRLARYFRRHRPHVVQGHLFWAYVLGAFGARLASVPIVVGTRRGLPAFNPSHARHRRLERFANALTTIVVANSGQVREHTLAAERLLPQHVVTIHNGVAGAGDAPAGQMPASRAPLGLEDTGEVVICVANLIDYKGHGDLLEAWPQVRRQCPSAWLLLVGDGPERASIEALARSMEGVRVLGARDDVPALLRASTLLVQASHGEGLPNAVLEAMAAGLPVVATDVGGTRELVVDGVTGRLVPTRTPGALASAVVALLRDPDARRRMGGAAAARARAGFSVEAMVSNYEGLYGRLLAEAGL